MIVLAVRVQGLKTGHRGQVAREQLEISVQVALEEVVLVVAFVPRFSVDALPHRTGSWINFHRKLLQRC